MIVTRKIGREKFKRYSSAIDNIKEKHGTLDPRVVVREARPRRSPLHDYFCWNNTEAAERYRLEQAKNLIRLCVTIIEEKQVRKWVSLKSDRKPGASFYRATVEVLSEDEQREQMLQDALDDLKAFKRKYIVLKELCKIFDEVDRLDREAAEKAEKKKRKSQASRDAA